MVKYKCISFPSLTEVDWILKYPRNLCSDIYKGVAKFTSQTKLEVSPILTFCSKLSLEPWVLQHRAKNSERGNIVLKIPQMHTKKTIAGVGRHDIYVIFRVINECKNQWTSLYISKTVLKNKLLQENMSTLWHVRKLVFRCKKWTDIAARTVIQAQIVVSYLRSIKNCDNRLASNLHNETTCVLLTHGHAPWVTVQSCCVVVVWRVSQLQLEDGFILDAVLVIKSPLKSCPYNMRYWQIPWSPINFKFS